MTQLVGHDINPGTPAWSPDGSYLAFAGANGLYVIRRNGTELGRVAKLYFGTNPPTPSWSPDGRFLAFVDENVTIVDKTTGAVRIVLDDIGAFRYGDGVSWTHDGRSLVFSVSGHGDVGGALRNGVYRIRIDGTGLAKIARL